jgi:hypothetical protein
VSGESWLASASREIVIDTNHVGTLGMLFATILFVLSQVCSDKQLRWVLFGVLAAGIVLAEVWWGLLST